MIDAIQEMERWVSQYTITFDDLFLTVLYRGKKVTLIENASISLPRRTLALIGESRIATEAMLGLLCRRVIPQKGKIKFNGSVSWPIGHNGPFSVAITGTQAISHFATIYGLDRQNCINFIKAEFAEPSIMTQPMSKWPKKLQTQFEMLMALIPEFDIYVVDTNLIMTEDTAFSRRFLELFNARRKNKTTLITVRQMKVLQAMCDGALVVANRSLSLLDDLETALEISNKVTFKDEPETAPDRENYDDDLLF